MSSSFFRSSSRIRSSGRFAGTLSRRSFFSTCGAGVERTAGALSLVNNLRRSYQLNQSTNARNQMISGITRNKRSIRNRLLLRCFRRAIRMNVLLGKGRDLRLRPRSGQAFKRIESSSCRFFEPLRVNSGRRPDSFSIQVQKSLNSSFRWNDGRRIEVASIDEFRIPGLVVAESAAISAVRIAAGSAGARRTSMQNGARLNKKACARNSASR